MTNPQYLAQVGHFLGGYAVILTTTTFAIVCGAGWTPVIVVTVIGVAAASAKEFWYDMKYELPKQTWADSLMDWAFYMLGAGVGWGMSALAMFLHK